AACDQLGVQPRAAVAALQLPVNRFELDDQGVPLLLALRGRAGPPGVEAASRDLQHPAEQPHRPVLPMVLDEGVPHDDSLAKKAVAFFKMSRSIWSRLFSARRWRSSSSRAGGLPCPGKACSPSAARARFQLRSR